MLILVINAGSSSLKYQLMNPEDGTVFAKGNCERIGIKGSFISYTRPNQPDCEKETFDLELPNHSEAMGHVLKLLVDPEIGVIKSMDAIDAVGHRILHGGEKFAGSYIVTPEVVQAIRDVIPLGPLHNPANLAGLLACKKAMPDTPQVAVFDTAFHQTMPRQAYMYALPWRFYERDGVRRYGFHGTSHWYVSEQCSKALGGNPADHKIITCHLGNGSSIAAVSGGKSVDTSMGMTPLAGLPMGTRCGDIDPAIIKYLMELHDDLSLADIDHIMNKESGMLGISGVSSDFRDLVDAARGGNDRAQLALEMFVYSVRKYIGAYAAAMGGVDAIVFTAGVGENNSRIRFDSCAGLEFMGIKIDAERNRQANRKGGVISTDDSTVKVMVILTNEELAIARETARLVNV